MKPAKSPSIDFLVTAVMEPFSVMGEEFAFLQKPILVNGLCGAATRMDGVPGEGAIDVPTRVAWKAVELGSG
jgi:hypothetical protein